MYAQIKGTLVRLSLSLSLYQSSAVIAAVILLRALLRFYDLDKYSVFFVRWFWRPFFEQVVFALVVLVVTSESDVSPVVKRHFRLFDKIFEAIELAIPCSVEHALMLYPIRYLSFFDDIFQDLHVTTACCLSSHFFFRLSRRFKI